MKKVICTLASAALVGSAMVVTPMSAVSAQTDGASDLVELCKELGEAAGFESVGECVSVVRTKGPIGFCQFLKEIDFLQAFGWRNQGECVTHFRSIQNQ